MAAIITLLLVGLVLLFAETLLPGMVAGLIGFGCLVAAVVMAYGEFGAAGGTYTLLGVIAGLVVLGVIWLRVFPHSRLGRIFVAKETIGRINAEKPELLGREGVALTPLRPSGMAEIDGRRVDVVTEGGLIEPGTRVKVVAVEGLRVVVRPL
ncbi:MAG: hypothetical protein D6766_08830 [Verrucomicrobia bacterium]|nr:MAG: hypothetical protein D6766_08830 [Verrucomicrobiota bacterium]